MGKKKKKMINFNQDGNVSADTFSSEESISNFLDACLGTKGKLTTSSAYGEMKKPQEPEILDIMPNDIKSELLGSDTEVNITKKKVITATEEIEEITVEVSDKKVIEKENESNIVEEARIDYLRFDFDPYEKRIKIIDPDDNQTYILDMTDMEPKLNRSMDPSFMNDFLSVAYRAIVAFYKPDYMGNFENASTEILGHVTKFDKDKFVFIHYHIPGTDIKESLVCAFIEPKESKDSWNEMIEGLYAYGYSDCEIHDIIKFIYTELNDDDCWLNRVEDDEYSRLLEEFEVSNVFKARFDSHKLLEKSDLTWSDEDFINNGKKCILSKIELDGLFIDDDEDYDESEGVLNDDEPFHSDDNSGGEETEEVSGLGHNQHVVEEVKEEIEEETFDDLFEDDEADEEERDEEKEEEIPSENKEGNMVIDVTTI